MGEIFVVVEHRKGEVRKLPTSFSGRPMNFAGINHTR
jgi:hypothetical protein